MISQTLTIARNTFIEAVRQPIYFILIALSGVLTLLTTWTAAYSMDYSSSAEVSADNKLMLDINLATVFVAGMLLAAFLATAVLSKEIERKTVLTVVSKPVARPTVVIGKYIGVSAAIVIAVTTMLLFVQLAVRHQVMSTTADDLDGPVLTFGLLAVGIALAVGVWCNFFYGWSFTQTSTLVLFPLLIAAYIGVLLVSKKWTLQPIGADFKPQVALASVCLLLSQLVLASIAVAVSARLGQVMTLVILCGAFLLGLMSNYLIGRHAVVNEFFAQVDTATPELQGMAGLQQPGDRYNLTLKLEPRIRVRPGDTVFYGASPGGFGLMVMNQQRFDGDITSPSAISDRSKPPALVVLSQNQRDLSIIRTGAAGPLVVRPPIQGDYLFLRPTTYNWVAVAAWTVIPNIQFFWLVDAVSQNQPIPLMHVGLVALYAAMQVGVFLCLGIILFQKREVG